MSSLAARDTYFYVLGVLQVYTYRVPGKYRLARKMLHSVEPEEFFCRLSISIDLPRSFL
jgi:hypothetical protein